MDPETENQLASLIMEEAKRLRQQADREGVHVYLSKPTVRGRPNSQFLTATVRGVQQANRMAEVNEMWRLREKELELEQQTHHSKSHKYQKSALSDRSRQNLQDRSYSKSKAYISPEEVTDYRNKSSSSDKAGCSEDDHYHSAKRKRVHEDTIDSGDLVHESETDSGLRNEGFCDEEIEAFLKSRAKRGRGAVGSRMDEPGPYLKSDGGESSSVMPPEVRVKEDWEQRIIGPKLPFPIRDVGSLTGMEKLKNKFKNKERKDKSKRHSKMNSDVDNETSSKKSKNKHEKEKRKKRERKKEKEKRR